MERYWKIDLIDRLNGNDGFSVCVSTEGNETEDSIVDLAIAKEVIDKHEVFDYHVTVEEITNNSYEMKHWKSLATKV